MAGSSKKSKKTEDSDVDQYSSADEESEEGTYHGQQVSKHFYFRIC